MTNTLTTATTENLTACALARAGQLAQGHATTTLTNGYEDAVRAWEAFAELNPELARAAGRLAWLRAYRGAPAWRR